MDRARAPARRAPPPTGFATRWPPIPGTRASISAPAWPRRSSAATPTRGRVRARARARPEADAGARAARTGPVPHGRAQLARPHLRDAGRDDARTTATRGPRSSAGGAKRSCTIACSRRSDRTSPCRSRDRRKRRSRPKRSTSLDRAYWRIGQLLGTYPSEPIAVVLYTGEQFRDITRSPSWAAGAYDGIIRVPMRGALDNAEELDRVLVARVHARARSARSPSRGVPAWLNEGLATALETGDARWAEHQPAQRAAGAAARAAVRLRPASAARRRSSPTRPARSPRGGCSTKPAASRSPTCCAISARASISTPRSCTASSGRSPNSNLGTTTNRMLLPRKPIVAVLTLGLLTAIFGLRGADLYWRRAEIVKISGQRAANLASILSEYHARHLRAGDASLRQLALHSRRIGGPGAADADWAPSLASARAGLSGVGSISITDAQGIIRHSTAAADHRPVAARRVSVPAAVDRQHRRLRRQHAVPDRDRAEAVRDSRRPPADDRRRRLRRHRRHHVHAGGAAELLPHGRRRHRRRRLGAASGRHRARSASRRRPIRSASRRRAIRSSRRRSSRERRRSSTAPSSRGGPEMLSAFRVIDDAAADRRRVARSPRGARRLAAPGRRVRRVVLRRARVDDGRHARRAVPPDGRRRPRPSSELRAGAAGRSGSAEGRERAAGRARSRSSRRARRETEAAARLKDEFLMTVSHELRTPLTAICGWAQMLATGDAERAADGAAIETIERNARAQTRLIDDLLDVSRVDRRQAAARHRGRSTSADVVREAVETMRPAADAKTHPRSMPSIDPDAGIDRRRPRPPAADRLEPAVERDQVHAGRRTCGVRRVQRRRPTIDDRRPRHRRRHLRRIPAARVRALPSGGRRPHSAATAASGSASRSSGIWSSCTAAR